MSAKHTPGPWRIAPPRRGSAWRVHADNPNRAGKSGRKPGHALSFIGVASVRQSAADATLIALAPELLIALRELADAVIDTLRSHPETECCAVTRERIGKALALIDKAEGRS